MHELVIHEGALPHRSRRHPMLQRSHAQSCPPGGAGVMRVGTGNALAGCGWQQWGAVVHPLTIHLIPRSSARRLSPQKVLPVQHLADERGQQKIRDSADRAITSGRMFPKVPNMRVPPGPGTRGAQFRILRSSSRLTD